jgi:hypothetical protein
MDQLGGLVGLGFISQHRLAKDSGLVLSSRSFRNSSHGAEWSSEPI